MALLISHQPSNRLYILTSVIAVLTTVGSCLAFASECTRTSIGLTPINDLGKGLYLGQFEGGLYSDGSNTPPATHHGTGIVTANSVTRLDPLGNPDPGGTIVLLSIGMSNANREFCTRGSIPPCNAWSFTGQALAHPEVDKAGLAIANGARGGQTSAKWDSPFDENYDRVRDEVLLPMALTESQVQVVWVKQARPGPDTSLPDQDADAFTLLKELGDIVRAVKVRYPNIQQTFFSSRIYAGYASNLLNPEPYAYESGFAVKWLIEAQIKQRDDGVIDPVAGDLDDTIVPWLSWSAYLWADGEIPRQDGLSWACTDFDSDGTHPAQAAEQKVGKLLLDFFLDSPYSQPWFAAADTPPMAKGTSGELVVAPSSIEPGDRLTIAVIDQDINVDANTIEATTVNVVNNRSNEGETVILEESGLNTNAFQGTLATLKNTTIGANDDGVMHVQANDILTVTYKDAADDSGTATTAVVQSIVNSDEAAYEADSTSDNVGKSGGGCTIRSHSVFDPSLPALLALIIGLGWIRRSI